jgi:DNA-binding transcriptional LysR family regulator
MHSAALHNFEWGLLKSFLAVARAGRLTIAAQRLGIDHSTLSRRIMALEKDLQTRLFDRAATGYALTSAGEQLMHHAQEVESVMLRIHTELGGANRRVAGTIRIGAPEGFGTFFLAPLLGSLGALHPELNIELVTLPRIFSLSRREADLAIGLARPEEGRLHAHKLTDYELGLYASSTYLDANAASDKFGPAFARPVSSANLGEHRFIGYISDLIYASELDYLPLINPYLHPGFSSSNLLAQLAATRAGHGLCILPCFIAEAEPSLRRVMEDDVILRRSFWLTFHADMKSQARVTVVSRFITESVRAAQARFLPTERNSRSS